MQCSRMKPLPRSALGERACWKHWERGRRLDEHPFEMTSLLPVNMCGPEVVPRAMRDDNLKLYYATQGFVPVEDSISFWVDVRDVGITTCEALFTDVASSNGKRYVMSAAQVGLSISLYQQASGFDTWSLLLYRRFLCQK